MDHQTAKKKPVFIEVTSTNGATKWVKDIVSHDEDEILAAVATKKGHLQVTDKYGGVTTIDLEDTYVVRVQNEETFLKRSRDANASR